VVEEECQLENQLVEQHLLAEVMVEVERLRHINQDLMELLILVEEEVLVPPATQIQHKDLVVLAEAEWLLLLTHPK